MPRYWYFAYKELLQIIRDRNALALLFVMPALFILIMSLALQGGFESRRKVQIDYFLVDQAGTQGSGDFTRLMDESGSFRRLTDTVSVEEARGKVARDEAKFLLVLPADFDAKLGMGDTAAQLDVAPGTELPLAMLFEARVRQALTTLYFEQGLGPVLEAGGLSVDADTLESLLVVESLYEGERGRQIPTSVQQGVPGWLLFAMFFVSVPLSTTLIGERQNGTLARLQTMSLPAWQMICGKMLPYVAINLCQVVAMLLVGVYLVPLLGGDRLVMGDSWAGLALMALATSLAAVSFGLFIAQLVRTHEQATITAGVSNIIMAAIGGIMVPRFLMPETMQSLAWISPMTWGMEGYLDLFLRGGTVVDILPECAGLVSFAVVMLSLALWSARRRGVV